MSVNRYSVWGDEMFEEKHALNSTNGMVHLMVKHEDYAALEQKLAESQREFRSADITMQNLEAQLKQSKIDADCYKKGMEASNARLVQLAAENAKLADCANFYRLGFKPAKGAFGIEYRPTEQLLDDCGNTALEAIKTPATDAFLAEVRASAILEGYALVPQQIFLEPSDIESICSQCGDGHESGYGDFTDGLLWVGSIQRDDGSIVHGMHISSADYSEEGGVTVCEFAAQLRNGVQS